MRNSALLAAATSTLASSERMAAPICWTWGGYGYLGGEERVPYGEKLESISSGGSHVYGLRAVGTALCWGENRADQSSPPSSERLTQISSGFAYALREDGSPVCWGKNENGEASPPEGEHFIAIATGIGLQESGHTCALRQDGSSVCWGHDHLGQASPSPNERFSAISNGSYHTCALRLGDGTAVCWGHNQRGQSTPPEDEAFFQRWLPHLRAAPPRRHRRLLGVRPFQCQRLEGPGVPTLRCAILHHQRGASIYLRDKVGGRCARLLGCRVPAGPG